jgi:hypothetical protein
MHDKITQITLQYIMDSKIYIVCCDVTHIFQHNLKPFFSCFYINHSHLNACHTKSFFFVEHMTPYISEPNFKYIVYII